MIQLLTFEMMQMMQFHYTVTIITLSLFLSLSDL